MKTLITVLLMTVTFNGVAEASLKGSMYSALKRVALVSMDEKKLIKGFNDGLMSTRVGAIEGLADGSRAFLLQGKLSDNSHFVIEVVSSIDEAKNITTVLKLSSNTRNVGTFSDMFRTLKTGPGFPRKGDQDEWVGTLMVDTKNLTEVNEKLIEFLLKAKNNSFNTEIQMRRSADVLPFKANK